ncbi:MAG: TetR/AcrR family transcriptional regulator [Parvibaculum sp.]|nr:TetR/AcrR family transcriptional regulator [Parvibaculum sp.]
MSLNLSSSTARGRPRSAKADSAILDAATDAILEAGFDATTLEDVAFRAGVSKATLYRRYASKEALALAVLERVFLATPLPQTKADGTSIAEIAAIAGAFYRSRAGEIVVALLPLMHRDHTVGATVRNEIMKKRRQALVDAIDSEAIREDVEREAIVDVLIGAVFYRFLATGRPAGSRQTEQYARIASFGALRPSAKGRKK